MWVVIQDDDDQDSTGSNERQYDDDDDDEGNERIKRPFMTITFCRYVYISAVTSCVSVSF